MTVPSWNEDGPDGRIKLMGIFPGAEVIKGSIWPYVREVLVIYYVLYIKH